MYELSYKQRKLNPFIPEFLKWTLPALVLDMSICCELAFIRRKTKQNKTKQNKQKKKKKKKKKQEW